MSYTRYYLSGVYKSFTSSEGVVSISPDDDGHNIILRSTSKDTEPLEIKLDDAELADLIRSIRSHGWTRDVKNLKNLGYSKKKFETYQFILPGYNVRPTEINAATGATQLKKLNNLIKERRKNFTLYQKNFPIFHLVY